MFVITGGGSGIGRALAHALATRGKPVLVIGRREAMLAETAAFSPLIQTFCADVSLGPHREKIAQHLADKALDGLVHNAAVLEPFDSTAPIEYDAWQKALETNLNAPLFLSQLLLPQLTDRRVLHIGSGVAYFPVQGWTAYCVTKAALSMLTRCWQLKCQNPAFASVMPGIIDTDMQVLIRQSEHMDDEKRHFSIQLHQQKKLLTPDTVALFLSYLLLDLPREEFSSKEWDIYDTTHHNAWLKLPHNVPLREA